MLNLDDQMQPQSEFKWVLFTNSVLQQDKGVSNNNYHVLGVVHCFSSSVISASYMRNK